MPGFIGDGLDLDGTIPEVPDVYEEVNITYRPLTPEQHGRFFDKWQQVSADTRLKRSTKILVDHLQTWDLQDLSKDEPREVPIDSKTVNQIHPRLRQAILDLIAGYPDTDEGN